MIKMCNLNNLQILIIAVIYTSAMMDSASSASEENKPIHMTKNIMQLNEKFEYLNEKLEILEETFFTGYNINVNEINVNVKQIMDALVNVVKKINNFEELFNKIEELDKKTDNSIKDLMKKIDQKANERERKNDVISEMTKFLLHQFDVELSSLTHKTSKQFKKNLEIQEICIKNENSTIKIYLKPSTNACEPDPCLNGSRCEVTGSHSRCTRCNSASSEEDCKACENGDHCFEGGGKTYAVYEERITFDEAKQKCANIGMTLVMPKQKESTEFVIGQLRNIYGATNGTVRFWFGVKSNEKGFEWMDGSPLGDYTGGNAHFKHYQGVLCGILHLHSRHHSWFYDHCPYFAYTVCEKQI